MRRFNCAAQHFRTATRVNSKHRDGKFRRGTCGARDLMRNIVKLQVEKNFRASFDDSSYELRAIPCE
jgi:hypothetical protein